MSTNILQIESEDVVYDFALKWDRRHYPKFEDRRDALFYKSEEAYQQLAIATYVGNDLGHCYMERAYKFRSVKALEFEAPHQQSVVYLDLKRDECVILFPEGKFYSQGFHLGMQMEESEPFTIDYEFSVRIRPDNKFVSMYMGSQTLSSDIEADS
uniref:Uncharacterized protein n=1 Tax=Solanum lycopersicum TaxID=4081 RepID=A0A3Q7HPQ4_SOLLC